MGFLNKNEIDYDSIPDSLNLESGVYPQAEVTAAKVITNKTSSISSLILTFKDMDTDSDTFGKDWGYFIKLPNPQVQTKAEMQETLVYYKRNLKQLGLTDHQIANLDDPEMDEDSKDWLLEIEGILHLKKNGQYTNLVKFERTSPNSAITQGGGERHAVARNVAIDDGPIDTTVPEPVKAAATASSDDWD